MINEYARVLAKAYLAEFSHADSFTIHMLTHDETEAMREAFQELGWTLSRTKDPTQLQVVRVQTAVVSMNSDLPVSDEE